MTRRRRALPLAATALALTAALAAGPGCIVGSPLAAISGKLYGMTRDDVDAIQGERPPIWGGHPVIAVIDIPFAFVLDTGFFPIALIFAGIDLLVSDDDPDEPAHDHDHGDGEADHHHGDGEADHDHGDGGADPAARDAARDRDAAATRARLERERQAREGAARPAGAPAPAPQGSAEAAAEADRLRAEREALAREREALARERELAEEREALRREQAAEGVAPVASPAPAAAPPGDRP